MKQVHRSLIHAALSILILMPCSTLAQQQQPIQLKEPSDTQITIFRALRNVLLCPAQANFSCAGRRFTGQALEIDDTRQKHKGRHETTHYSIDMRTLPKVTYFCELKGKWSLKPRYECSFKFENGQKPSPAVALLFEYYGDAARGSNGYAGRFLANALNRVHEFSLQTDSPLHNFSQAAAAWRALPQRPPISDAVRVQRLLAEEALKQGQPYMALYYYESGLEKDPLWPEGYFNAALVAASLEMYWQAAEHMQSYLDLMPDAADAQKARDQIGMWKYKAQEK